jgi:hypothetical protein
MTEPFTDGLDPVRAVRPDAPGPDAEALGRARSSLMQLIDETPRTTAVTSLRRRRRTIGLAVAAVATLGIGGTAAAGSLFSEETVSNPTISCLPDLTGNDATFIHATSGDPTVDCSPHLGVPAADLVAAQDAEGRVTVTPRAAGLPPGAQALPPGFRKDAGVLQLDHELGDPARGLHHDGPCRSTAEARKIVDAQLRRLNLEGWTVDARDTPPGTCAVAIVKGPEKEVDLSWKQASPPFDPAKRAEQDRQDIARGVEPMPPHDADRNLSERLAAAMVSGPQARCTSAADAARTAESAAKDVGLGKPGYMQVRPGFTPAEAPDGTSTCVRPSVGIGGSTFVHLDVVTKESFEQNR